MNPYDLLLLLNESQLSSVTEGCTLRLSPSSNSWVIERLEEDNYILIRPNSFGQVEINLPLCSVRSDMPEGALIPIMLLCDGLGGKISLVRDDQSGINLCYSCILSTDTGDADIYNVIGLIRSEYYICLERIDAMRKIASTSGSMEELFSLRKLDNMFGNDKTEGEEQ